MLDGSGGNPRLIIEVIEGLAQAAVHGEPADHIPSALVRTVRRFMTRLGQGPREVAELAPVLARPLTAGEACALLPGQAEADAAAGIDRGIAVGLLSESAHAVRVRFDLIREAIYGDLPTARRAGLHLRCGRYLATTGDPRAAAGHAEAAARDGQAGAAAARIWQELALGWLAEAEASALALAELGRELDRTADQQLAQAVELVITRLRGPANAGHNVFTIGKRTTTRPRAGGRRCGRGASQGRRGCGSRGRCGWRPSWGWRPGTGSSWMKRRPWPSWRPPATRGYRCSVSPGWPARCGG